MAALPVCMSVQHVYAWSLCRPEEGVRFLETGVADGCQLPLKCSGLNLSTVEEEA